MEFKTCSCKEAENSSTEDNFQLLIKLGKKVKTRSQERVLKKGKIQNKLTNYVDVNVEKQNKLTNYVDVYVEKYFST